MATNTFPLKYRRKLSPPGCSLQLHISRFPFLQTSSLRPRNDLIATMIWSMSPLSLAMGLSLSSHPAVLVHPLWHLQIQKTPMLILYPLLFKEPSSALPHRLGPLFQDTISHTYQSQCPLQRVRMSLLHSLRSMRNHALAHPDLRSSSSHCRPRT